MPQEMNLVCRLHVPVTIEAHHADQPRVARSKHKRIDPATEEVSDGRHGRGKVIFRRRRKRQRGVDQSLASQFKKLLGITRTQGSNLGSITVVWPILSIQWMHRIQDALIAKYLDQ